MEFVYQDKAVDIEYVERFSATIPGNPLPQLSTDEYNVVPQGNADGNLPLQHTTKIIAEIFKFYDDSREGLEAQSKELTQFIHSVLKQNVVSGDADDWHNLAVDIAKREYFDLACKVLDVGLSHFPNNVDLLADYLQYGPSCGKTEQCKIYYDQLSKMPMVKYTWRSFHFSASWLTHLWGQSNSEEELNKLTEALKTLVKQYRRYFPNSEESYLCESNIYRLTKESKEEIKVLNQAIKRTFPTPKCALRLADYFFEAGEYKKSLEMIQRSLRDANQVQQAVNESYLWFLSGLAKISLSQTQEAAPQPHDIEDIYSDFESSLRLGVRSSLRDSICKKAALLRHKHNVEIPSQCSRLFELLDDGQMLD